VAEKKKLIPESISRVVYYVLSVCCFFLVFLLAVGYSSDRLDAVLILTIIIAVLLLTFMLVVSQLFSTLEKKLKKQFEKMKQDE